MSITNYSELQTAIGNNLHRSDLTSRTVEWITLCEAGLNNGLIMPELGVEFLGLRVRQMETRVTATINEEYGWWLSENGVQVATPSAFAWVTYKIRTVRLFGDTFSATATYTASLDQVYYSSTSTRGNFYNCAVTTSAGQDPDDTPASWTIVNVPLIFQRYLELGAWADYLLNDGQTEKAALAERMAQEQLDYQQCLLVGQQLQTKRTMVMSR